MRLETLFLSTCSYLQNFTFVACSFFCEYRPRGPGLYRLPTLYLFISIQFLKVTPSRFHLCGNAENIVSNQMHRIRVALPDKDTDIMDGNSMVRRVLRSILSENPQFERLLPHAKGLEGH